MWSNSSEEQRQNGQADGSMLNGTMTDIMKGNRDQE